MAIWQGLKATKLGTNEPMCLNHAAVDAALALGADVETTACRRGQRGGPPIVCPFYEGEGQCHYQAQKAEAFAADVLFVAHEGLFQLPPGVCDGFGLVIIDESFWQKGLSGAREDDRPRLAIGGLNEELKDFPVWIRMVRNGKRERVVSEDMTQELREITGQLQAALTAAPDGYVQSAALEAAGLEACGRARALEWARKVPHGVKPDASPEQLKDAVKKFGFLAQIKRRVEMWSAISEILDGTEEATGRLRIETVTTKEGSIRWLYISGRKRIDKRLMRLPIICADANLPLELTRYYLRRLELVLDLVVDAPHMRITQLTGLPVGKMSLQAQPAGKRKNAIKETEAANKRQRLVDTARHLVGGRKGLVITYKAIEKEFEALDGVEVAHYGDIEGIDRWGDVDALVIIGRPLPWEDAIQLMAAAITGKPVVAEAVKQKRQVCGVNLQCWIYPDATADLVRAAITEAAVEQAVGRVRGVNRTALNPVEVFMVLDDVVVRGLPVDEVVKFQKAEPGPVDEMLARGWGLQSPSDAHRLFPDLFPTPAAAQKSYQRGGLGLHRRTSSYKDNVIRKCPPVDPSPPQGTARTIVRYQRQGARQRPWLGWVDPIKVPDPRAVLEAAFNKKLALFEVLDGEVKPEPERKPKPAAATPGPVTTPVPVAPAAATKAVTLHGYRGTALQLTCPGRQFKCRGCQCCSSDAHAARSSAYPPRWSPPSARAATGSAPPLCQR